MAPCRQLIMWSVPSIAVLLGIYWFKKKREYIKCDPGGREKMKCLKQELAEALNAKFDEMKNANLAKADLAVIKSLPIDIVPNGCGSQHSSPMQLTDKEVDFEIDKIIRNKSLEKEKKNPLSTDSLNESNISISKSVIIHSDSNTSFNEDSFKKTISNKSDDERNHLLEKKCFDPKTSILSLESPITKLVTTNIATANDTIADIEDFDVDINEEDTCNKHDDCENSQYSNPQTRRLSERDSANHSPVDPLLASPSLCRFPDNHSERSSDSGKGCSEAASPPPANMNMVPSEAGLRIHQFLIPQSLVGLLIGKYGSFVTKIKAKTGATVYVRKHPELLKQKICAIEGTQNEIEAALELIKEKFPEKRFPNFTTHEISAELYQRLTPLVPEYLQLQLVESVNNDTIMTCLVSAGHFFLQQPLHPTFPSLHALHRLMASTYQNSDVPALPYPIKEGSICAAPTENNWYRAQIISVSEENDTSVVKLVDFGGYLTVDNDQLRQIRSDFMTLPFQATEALLALVKPANNEVEWSAEALRIMASLTAGQLLHAQVAGYDEEGRPLVHLYLTISPQQVIFLNREMVDRGLAEWDAPVES